MAVTHTLPAPRLHPHPRPQPAEQVHQPPPPPQQPAATITLAAWQQGQSKQEYLSGCRCLSHHCRKPKKARRGKRRKDRGGRTHTGRTGQGREGKRPNRGKGGGDRRLVYQLPTMQPQLPGPGSSPAGQRLQLRGGSPRRCRVGMARLRQAPERHSGGPRPSSPA